MKTPLKHLTLAFALLAFALTPLLGAPLDKKEEKQLKAQLGQALSSEDTDWGAVGEILNKLSAKGDGKTWKLMVKIVEKSPPKDQLEVTVLSKAATTMKGAAKEMKKTALKSRQPRIRRVLMQVLADQGEWDSLVKALKDKDEQTAAMAAWELIDSKQDKVVDPLIKRLEELEKDKKGIWDVLHKGLAKMLGLKCSSAIEYLSRWELVKSEGGLKTVKVQKVEKGSGTMVRVRLFGREIDCTRVVFVLDISGSMKEKDPNQKKYDDDEEGTRTRGVGGTKVDPNDPDANLLTRLERAQRQLRKVIKALPSNFKINVVAYSSHVQLWRGSDSDARPQLHPLTDKNRKDAIAFIDKFKAHGVTATDTALERAFEVEGARCFYLLSDGRATHDGKTPVPTEEILERLKAYEKQRVTIHTLGFTGADVAMMKAVAKATGGDYSDIK